MTVQKTLNNYSSELQSFRRNNGYQCELYVSEVIGKQLKICEIEIPYNGSYDLILEYQNRIYNIEVKSCKRWYKLKNGNSRDGIFRFKHSDIFENRNDIFAFCYYWNDNKYVVFVNRQYIYDYFNRKKKSITLTLSIKQLFVYFKSTKFIIDIINMLNKDKND
jgi:hypothetical protein